jgi:hypothetical protein
VRRFGWAAAKTTLTVLAIGPWRLQAADVWVFTANSGLIIPPQQVLLHARVAVWRQHDLPWIMVKLCVAGCLSLSGISAQSPTVPSS